MAVKIFIQLVHQFIKLMAVLVLLMSFQVVPSYAAAATPPAVQTCPTGTQVSGSSKNQVLGGLGETTSDCSGNAGGTAIAATVRILGQVIGILAVIMVINSGYKYITSAGDSNKVSSAKRGLIYAFVGLVIASLAEVMVHYVLNKLS